MRHKNAFILPVVAVFFAVLPVVFWSPALFAQESKGETEQDTEPAPGPASSPSSDPAAGDPEASAPEARPSKPASSVVQSPTPESEQPAQDDVETIVIVGSRSGAERTKADSPVAIDSINLSETAAAMGQVTLNELLQIVVPSFNASRQSGADGADHIDPATVRGLGPDQTLVLINGKRRHQSSLINIFGSRGRGNTGSDLNAIPIAAIERIEVLRDGASAMYGSDAIAGVINIVLKSNVETFTANASGGFHNADAGPGVASESAIDGEALRLDANYGFTLGDAGFANLTLDYLKRNDTNRPAEPGQFDIYRRKFGDAAVEGFGTFINAGLPVSDDTELYGFGGFGYRHTKAFAWSRAGDDARRNVPAIYPDGFDPLITSRIIDGSLSLGLRTELGRWKLDVNNTFGVNRFHYVITRTLNASLLAASPTRFDAGGHQFIQNTTGLHLSWIIPFLHNIYIGAGSEFRIDNYQIFAGEEGSYRNYGIVERVDGDSLVEQDVLDKAGGSQGFPGFQPANEVDEYRTNLAAYIDAEADLFTFLTAGAALRYELYSDFGDTLNVKLASLLKLSDLFGLDWMDGLGIRASFNTGFRAPSLAQIHYNTLFTDFEGGQAIDKVIVKNNSPLTRTLGIPRLRQETSISASWGLTAQLYDFDLSVDGYVIDIKDRIVLTGAFRPDDPQIGAELQALRVGAAQFFTNAVDTTSYGVDFVLSYKLDLGEHHFSALFAGNVNFMDLGEVQTSDRLAGKGETYFGNREQKFLLASAPRSKWTLSLAYNWFILRANARLTIFDRVVLIDWLDEEDVYEPNFTLDVSAGVEIFDLVVVTLGATNVLNAYPTQQDTETETGGLWDPVQMGFSGAFYYTKVSIKI